MKKIISIALALLLMASNIGFALNTHFCGGKAVETTFTLGIGNPHCGMEMVETTCPDMSSDNVQFRSKSCCENKHQVFQTDEMVKTQSTSPEAHPGFLSGFPQAYLHPVSIAKSTGNFFSYYSPPLTEKDVQVLFQTFLI